MKILALLFVLFVAIPVVEFTILIEVGRRIGTVYTLLMVFGAGILGAFVARMEGLRILLRIQDNLRSGIMPAEDLFDGFLVLAAGILLITPGMLSDIAGLILLLPPSRLPVKILLRRAVRQWIRTRTLRISTF